MLGCLSANAWRNAPHLHVQESEVGDGITSVVSATAELLSRANELVRVG
jgi:hypothetical protein